MLYTEKVMDHFEHPRNVGEIENADGVGQVGNPKCGDIMKMYLKIDDGVITDVNSQPLKADGSVIEGLYVCGNDQGGFYPHNYPSNFTGINAGRTATFARIAAKHALGVA